MALCDYSNIFGQPGEGVHAYKIGGIAIFDLLLTVIAAIIASKLSGKSALAIFALLIIIGEALHLAFCVDTTGAKFIKRIA